jgi:Protein of unknown function (DUF3300)
VFAGAAELAFSAVVGAAGREGDGKAMVGASGSRLVERFVRDFLALGCAVLLASGEVILVPQEGSAESPPAPAQEAPKIPPDQLDSLVAPIALYPDPLLAQTLVAATYPLEMIQLQQWLAKHPDLEDEALAEAVAKEPWDPSVQSMAAVPDVVKRLAEDIQWTTDLGNAFLAQQSDVMDAVQRMRKKAEDNGALESNAQQTVETKVIDQKTVIVVQPANPQVIYVPSYSPVVVYGPPVYPYPPIYYPPYPPGAAFVTFGFGVMMGAAFWGGSCCRCGWGHGDIDINVNNSFNRVNHYSGSRGSGTWQHNPQHRGGAPYADRATATKYGGTARGQARAGRQPSAIQQPARPGKGTPGGAGAPGVSDRTAGAAGSRAGNRGSTVGTGSRPAKKGGDQIGNRHIPSSGGSRAGAFGGGSSGFSGSKAHTSSMRGASSMGSRGGGGGSRGGGMGGGRRR